MTGSRGLESTRIGSARDTVPVIGDQYIITRMEQGNVQFMSGNVQFMTWPLLNVKSLSNNSKCSVRILMSIND